MNSTGTSQRLVPFANTYRARSSCTSISEERVSEEPEDSGDEDDTLATETPTDTRHGERTHDGYHLAPNAAERTYGAIGRTRRASCAVDWRYQNHQRNTGRMRAESPPLGRSVLNSHKRQSLDALSGRRRLSVQVDGPNERAARARLGQRRETLKWAGVRVSIDEDSGKVENENVSVDLDPLKNIGKEVGEAARQSCYESTMSSEMPLLGQTPIT